MDSLSSRAEAERLRPPDKRTISAADSGKHQAGLGRRRNSNVSIELVPAPEDREIDPAHLPVGKHARRSSALQEPRRDDRARGACQAR